MKWKSHYLLFNFLMRKDRTKYLALPRVVVFIYYKDKLLLIKKSIEGVDGMSKPVFYPIGGHVEPGEDIRNAAIREIEEETGIKNSNPELKALIYNTGFDDYQIVLFIFKMEVDSELVRNSSEGNLKWIEISKFKAQNVFPDVEIFHLAIKESKKGEIIYGSSKFQNFELKEVILNGHKFF